MQHLYTPPLEQSVKLHYAVTFQLLHYVVTFDENEKLTNFGNLLQTNYMTNICLPRNYETLNIQQKNFF